MAINTLMLTQDGRHFANDVFKHNFWNENFWISDIQMCSLGSNWQYIIIGSDNGLAPNRQQAIIWTNDGLVN